MLQLVLYIVGTVVFIAVLLVVTLALTLKEMIDAERKEHEN